METATGQYWTAGDTNLYREAYPPENTRRLTQNPKSRPPNKLRERRLGRGRDHRIVPKSIGRKTVCSTDEIHFTDFGAKAIRPRPDEFDRRVRFVKHTRARPAPAMEMTA